MLRKRASIDEEEKMQNKTERKESDTKYYLKNRDKILDNARWNRINKWAAEWNDSPPGVYKCRNGKKCIGSSTENSRH
ncbi:hypothetical protein BT96DRAFT_1006915 [Gymnopus androsaceus JB14]|uniref:Uncharacterized protein n=1 Tax=Gymnopus androsaceus JB14 TaxID=1447944 RepID=A0A6A4GIS4_9AGAR|nr:hypothetical protein BT96DRAFT_1006915 [Gymnopus androsaceus JB14]